MDPTIPSAGRYNFIISTGSMGSSYLQIQALASREEGLYRCRVDYDHHQTLIWWSHLDIVGKARGYTIYKEVVTRNSFKV